MVYLDVKYKNIIICLGVNAVKLKVYWRYKNDILYHFYAYHFVIFMGEFWENILWWCLDDKLIINLFLGNIYNRTSSINIFKIFVINLFFNLFNWLILSISFIKKYKRN